MRPLFIFIIALFSGFVHGQQYHSPQIYYDAPGGFFDADSIRTIDITFYDANYDSILHDAWINNTGLRLPATIQLDGGPFLPNVAVRYKGNSTYALPRNMENPKLPFNLDINDWQPGQTLMGQKKVKLANAFLDPTFVKELTAAKIYRKYLPTPEVNLMKLNVQGTYLGLYVNTEAIDGEFLKKHFQENNGVLIKCDPIQQFGQPGPTGSSDLNWLGSDTTLYYNHYDVKTAGGWAELVHFIDVLNNNPTELDSVLNVDRTLWALAVNQAIANLDTYNGLYQHNYYLYQTGDGLFQMIPWDLSESYIGALLGTNVNTTALYEYDPYNGYNCWWYPLVQRLTANPYSEYGKIYTAHLRTIIEESLNSTDMGNYISGIQSNALPAVLADTNKVFGNLAYYSNVNNELIIPSVISIGGITSTIDLRKPYLEGLGPVTQSPPVISDVSLINQGGSYYVQASVSNAFTVELMSTKNNYNSKFTSTVLLDNGTNGDLVAGDGIYTGPLPSVFNGETIKYYIKAKNLLATELNPKRAEYEFYYFNPNNTGVDEIDEITLTVYPNPASDYVSITSNFLTEFDIEITDSFGQLIEQARGSNGASQINCTNYPAGIYFVRVGNLVERLIIQ